MSIRTTITLDEDIVDRVKFESRSRGRSFRQTLNDLLRLGLLQSAGIALTRKLTINPVSMGHRAGLNFDDVEGLLAYGEGERHL